MVVVALDTQIIMIIIYTMNEHDDNSANATCNAASPAAAEQVEYRSLKLFQGRREVIIQHAGQTYRLRITRQNRLILTK